MTIWTWLNDKRIRDYPRLVFIAGFVVLFLNILLHQGWIGGLSHHLMWGDFLVYYAAGKLYTDDIAHLYNLKIQEITQFNLISSSEPLNVSFYSYPPNAALMHAALTYLPLKLAIVFWWVLSMFCVILAAYLIKRYLFPDWLIQKGFSTFQLAVIIFSSFAFIEGFETGQSHSLTLLLIVAVLVATKQEKWLLAGFLAAISTFKPQFIIGFLVLWLIWGKYKAIISFIAFTCLWNGIVILDNGISPYFEFLKFSNQMIYLPYATEGFPNSLMATPFTLIATMLPFNLAPIWNKIFLLIGAILIILFAILAYKTRKQPVADQNLILALAILLPLLAFPYALLHDLLILIPVLFLLAVTQEHREKIKSLAVIVYVAMFVLPLLGYAVNVALTALIPITIFVFCFQPLLRLLRTNPEY